jgi:diguanylate cyclase (GGDEF)-like protein
VATVDLTAVTVRSRALNSDNSAESADRRTSARWTPRHWRLWALPSRALAYVLIVDAAAVLVVLATVRNPVTPREWAIGTVVAVSAILHLHATHTIERSRRDHSHAPHVDLASIWIFAGALLLPPGPETLLLIVIYLHRWYLVGRWDITRPPYRTWFNASMMTLSALTASAVAGIHDARDHLGSPGVAWINLTIVVAAISAQWLVNSGLLAGVIALTTRVRQPRDVLGTGEDNLLEVAQLVLGLFVAIAVYSWPGYALLMVVPVAAIHRTVLLHQLKLAASTDDKTGLLNATAWEQQAKATLLRTRTESGLLAIFMLDLDFFKTINDRYGHLAGDAALRKVAQVIAASVRRGDTVGRFGGEEFAVLLPAIGRDDALHVAERIRTQIRQIHLDDGASSPVTGLSVSIGIAMYPQVNEDTITGLMAAADAALYEAKNGGRDQVRVAGQDRRIPWSPTNRHNDTPSAS